MNKLKATLSALAMVVAANSYAVDIGNGIDVDEGTKTLVVVINKDGSDTLSASYGDYLKSTVDGVVTHSFDDLSYVKSSKGGDKIPPAKIDQLVYYSSNDRVEINVSGLQVDGTKSSFYVGLYPKGEFPISVGSLEEAFLSTESINITLSGGVHESVEISAVDGAPESDRAGHIGDYVQGMATSLGCDVTGDLEYKIAVHSDKFDASGLARGFGGHWGDAIGSIDGSVSWSLGGLSQGNVGFNKQGSKLDLSLLNKTNCQGISSLEEVASLRMMLAFVPTMLNPTEMPYTAATVGEVFSFLGDLISTYHVSTVGKTIEGIDLDKIKAEIESFKLKQAKTTVVEQ